VLPVSNVLADIIQSAGVAENRIHVMPNGVDINRFFPEIDGAEVRRKLGLGNQIVLGFIGFVRAWHGLDRVVDFMAKWGRVYDLGLVVVGDGPAIGDVQHLARRLGVLNSVRFVGSIDRTQIPRYVAAFDIALQPSAMPYASPLKLIEYMAMGKAIIAPDQPNVRELIDNRRTGLLVKADDATALAEAIVSFATNAELRRSLGCRAADQVFKRGLTWDANAARIEALAGQLVGN
jgi:glycosyltransferase involved in cell wall biosynthesis